VYFEGLPTLDESLLLQTLQALLRASSTYEDEPRLREIAMGKQAYIRALKQLQEATTNLERVEDLFDIITMELILFSNLDPNPDPNPNVEVYQTLLSKDHEVTPILEGAGFSLTLVLTPTLVRYVPF